MMRRLALPSLLLFAVFLHASTGRAQGSSSPEEARALLLHQRAAMTALTAWGGLSTGVGAALMVIEADDPFLFWGGLQHLLWGATNVVIGSASVYKANHTRPSAIEDVAVRARRMRRVLWINAGLDVLYVASASLLWGLSERREVQGSGAAILVQGGFLLAFDISAACTVP